MERVKQMLIERMNRSVEKLEDMNNKYDPVELKNFDPLKERFIEEVATLCGFRYLYYFLEYPETDPIGIAEDVLGGFSWLIDKTNILPFRRLIHGIRRL